MYSAAAYDDALTALNILRKADGDHQEIVEQYRAFCLMALGRTAEATSAIEAAVAASPFSQPLDADVSPRLRSAFREVRQRVLPGIIERQYADARVAFDRKDKTAPERFKQVIALIGDADLQSVANQPPLSVMRGMAKDFLVLSTPQAPVAPPLLPRREPPNANRPPAPPPPRDASRIYGPEDFTVVPPSVIRQSFAAMAEVFALRPGTVEIVVDETGTVTAATTRAAVNSVYDRLALATAKTWRYRPAMLDGAAVKYRFAIQLQLQQRH
jgi:TonB family protein